MFRDPPRHRGPIVALTVACLTCAASPSYAYRPYDGTDADVAESKTVEIEIAPVEVLRYGSVQQFRAPAVTLGFGVGRGYEIGIEAANVFAPRPEPGEPHAQLVDAGIAIKKLLRRGQLQDAHGPSVATEVSIDFPGRDEAHVGGGVAAIASTAGDAGSLHLDLGVAQLPAGVGTGTAGLIVASAGHHGLHAGIELALEAERAGLVTRSALIALLYDVRDGLSFDAGVDFARSGGERSTELRAGFTRQISPGATEPIRNWVKYHLRRHHS